MTINEKMTALYQLCPEVHLKWHVRLNKWFVELPGVYRAETYFETSFTSHCCGATPETAIYNTWEQVTNASEYSPLVCSIQLTPNGFGSTEKGVKKYFYWTGLMWLETTRP